MFTSVPGSTLTEMGLVPCLCYDLERWYERICMTTLEVVSVNNLSSASLGCSDVKEMWLTSCLYSVGLLSCGVVTCAGCDV